MKHIVEIPVTTFVQVVVEAPARTDDEDIIEAVQPEDLPRTCQHCQAHGVGEIETDNVQWEKAQVLERKEKP